MLPATLEKVKKAIALYAVEGDLNACCAPFGLSRMTIYEARKQYPIIETEYRVARELRADSLADEVVEISDTETNPHKARIRCEVRLKVAGFLNRKEYGEHIDMTVDGRVDMSLALTEARQRVLSKVNKLGDILDADVIDNPIKSLVGPADIQSVVDDPFEGS